MNSRNQEAAKAFLFSAILIAALVMVMLMMGCAPADKVSNQDDQIRALQSQLANQMLVANDLQLQYDQLAGAIVDLNVAVVALTTSLEAATVQNSTEVALLHSLLDNANALIATLQASLVQLQGQESATQVTVSGLVLQIATLQGVNNIIGIIDVCNDAPGIIDEVLLQLSGGRVLASFSDNAAGQNTRFSLIPNGSYSTTDGSNCHFTVNDGQVSW